jgi:hypothetical protein
VQPILTINDQHNAVSLNNTCTPSLQVLLLLW